MFKPCVVIPIYNHSAALRKKILCLATEDIRCYLVNDGSTDHSGETIDHLAQDFSFVRALHQPINQGKGAAVKAGLLQAIADGYSHALQIDADDQHNLADIPRFLSLAEEHQASLIAGYPVYDISLPASRKYARYITHFWVWIETLSLTTIKDSMCGFRVYPLKKTCALLAREKVADRMDFDIDIIVKLHWDGMDIVNVPTRVTYPEDGTSHFDMLHDNLRISSMHCRLFFRMLLQWLPQKLFQKCHRRKSLPGNPS
jgi:glycosyltransferase involved in cell wall biosynthesis